MTAVFLPLPTHIHNRISLDPQTHRSIQHHFPRTARPPYLAVLFPKFHRQSRKLALQLIIIINSFRAVAVRTDLLPFLDPQLARLLAHQQCRLSLTDNHKRLSFQHIRRLVSETHVRIIHQINLNSPFQPMLTRLIRFLIPPQIKARVTVNCAIF